MFQGGFDYVLGKFSLSVGSGKKKEKKIGKVVPDVLSRGGIVWPTQVISLINRMAVLVLGILGLTMINTYNDIHTNHQIYTVYFNDDDIQ